MVVRFIEALKEKPVIAAVRDMADLQFALKKDIRVIFLLGGDIFDLIEIKRSVRSAGHLFLLHLDLMKGVARDQVGISYLKKCFEIDGIISTHSTIIQYAKKERLIALQRLFIVDSESLKTGARLVHGSAPDSVEILPGVIMPYIKDRLAGLHLPPIVAGGLVESKEDVERIRALEPRLNPDAVGGLHAPGGGVIEPYRFVFSLIESAQNNGVELRTGFRVVEAQRRGDHFLLRCESGAGLTARYAVNAAGLYANQVSAAFGAEALTIVARKGEEFLLDRNARGLPSKVIFPVPNQASKGILVIPTVEGTCMVGPTAEEQEDKEDLSTTRRKRTSSPPSPPAPHPRGKRLLHRHLPLPQAAGPDPGRRHPVPRAHRCPGHRGVRERSAAEVPRLSDLSPYEADALIGSDAAYGEVVCRCESVSEAELLVSLDGEPLKRRKLAHVQPSEMVSFSLSREELPSDLKDNPLEVSIT